MLKNVKIEDVKPYENNPVNHKANVEHIVNSLKEFGYVKTSIVVNEDNILLAGHGTLQAMKKLKWELIPEVTKVIGLTEEQQRAVRIADNSSGHASEWDLELLDIELKDLPFDMSEFGLDYKKEIEPDPKDDEVPEVKDSICKLGDIWTLGNHKLLCGDCTDKANVERVMAGQKADMVFTDPPYGVSYADKNAFLNAQDKGNRIQTEIKNDHMSLDDIKVLWAKAFKILSETLNDYSCYYITAPQGGDLYLMMMMMMNENGLPLRHTIIWAKNNHVLGRTDYNYKHEPIIYGWSKRHKFYGNGEQRFSVWNFNKPVANKLHPTMKPVELIVNAIMNSTEKEMNVIDVFGGSGSTLISCEKTNRKCFMMELDEHYCTVILQRWADFAGQDPIREDGKKFSELK